MTIVVRTGLTLLAPAAPAETVAPAGGATIAPSDAEPAPGTPAVTTETVAGSAADDGPDERWRIGGFAFIVVGALVGWLLWKVRDPKPFNPGAAFSMFAPLYILAQSIERLLEPFSDAWGQTKGTDNQTKSKTDAKKERDEAVAAFLQQGTSDQADKAAEKQTVLDKIRKNSAVFSWGLASFLAMVACGAFGIRLLQAIGFDVPPFWDIAITGLAVGSGTKPLHDLISNLQKAKDQKSDPGAVETAR